MSLVSVEGRGVEAAADWGSLRSPENYVGTSAPSALRRRGGAVLDKSHVYAVPARLASN